MAPVLVAAARQSPAHPFVDAVSIAQRHDHMLGRNRAAPHVRAENCIHGCNNRSSDSETLDIERGSAESVEGDGGERVARVRGGEWGARRSVHVYFC